MISTSSSPIVTMMQPTCSLAREDATRVNGACSAVRGSFAQPQMGSVFVVIPEVFREQPLQMAFIHYNEGHTTSRIQIQYAC
jgi:hypothetical protein